MPPGTPTSHMGAGLNPRCFTSDSANDMQIAVRCNASVWVPATHVRDPGAPGLTLTSAELTPF